jgi:hypothetical protein
VQGIYQPGLLIFCLPLAENLSEHDAANFVSYGFPPRDVGFG